MLLDYGSGNCNLNWVTYTHRAVEFQEFKITKTCSTKWSVAQCIRPLRYSITTYCVEAQLWVDHLYIGKTENPIEKKQSRKAGANSSSSRKSLQLRFANTEAAITCTSLVCRQVSDCKLWTIRCKNTIFNMLPYTGRKCSGLICEKSFSIS